MVRFLWILVLLVLVVGLGVQLYFSSENANKLTTDYEGLRMKLNAAVDDSKKLQAEVEYFSNPDNLEKELKARFNYHLPGEKMIIVVPQEKSTP